MTSILAKELRWTGITDNCVAPGPTTTDLFFVGRSKEEVKRAAEASPFERLGQPAEVAAVVGFFCTDAAGGYI